MNESIMLMLYFACKAHFGVAFTDALYIPARLSLDFCMAATSFGERFIHHEVAVPAIFGMISADATDFQAIVLTWHHAL